MMESLFFFADENISPALITWINGQGYKISSVKKENMEGASDIKIIKRCFASQHVILTHDNDFGKIIFTNAVPFFC